MTVQAPEPPQTADAAALSQRLLRSYAPLRGGATPPASRPLRPLSERSQAGRVVLKGGVVVRQQALALVDASGASHALAPGVPVELPLQAVAIVAA